MKASKLICKLLFFAVLIFDIAVFSAMIYLNNSIGNEFKIKKGENLNISSPLPVTAHYNDAKPSEGEGLSVDLKMFGIIPISKANVQVVDRMQVALLGQPFGMKLYTRGVLVVDFTDISIDGKNVNPAKDKGLKVGDYILTANGIEISTNEDLMSVVENSQGKEITLKVLRDDKILNLTIAPIRQYSTDKYKIGVWVRDSGAGIGTLTFYSPAYNVICGLGHGVCDEDTGEILTLKKGEIVSAEIFSVDKGKEGTPGQLNGRLKNETLGEITLNCEGGVYSVPLKNMAVSNLTEIALKSEVKSGDAEILCTVDGDTPKTYSCKIALKKSNFGKETQNMVVTVTDESLLEKTGGIVQGLSGSPILQNGKLIGAVTHVLIDDPTKGYGIFAENMLETVQSVSESNKLKDAS